MPVGSTVGIAVDITAKSIWFRTGSGNWNNTASANPAAGAGGFSISTFQFDNIPGRHLARNSGNGEDCHDRIVVADRPTHGL